MVNQPSHSLLSAALLLPLSVQATSWWKPVVNQSWEIALSVTITPPFVNASSIDADLFSTPAQTWTDLKSSGRSAICYFSAGSSENWRPDFHRFTSSDIGAPLVGWQGENWLNTKSDNVRSIMTDRMDMAVKNGCNAIDPDNTDAYDNGGGGFGLTTDDARRLHQIPLIRGPQAWPCRRTEEQRRDCPAGGLGCRFFRQRAMRAISRMRSPAAIH